MKYFILAILVVSLIYSCGQPADNAAKTEAPDSLVFYGEKFEPGKPLTVAELNSKVSNEKMVTGVVVSGTIAEVCQNAGCWMNIDRGDGSTMMVKMKDHAFELPFDCGGKLAIFKGDSYYDTTSVEDLRHYAEDAMKSKEEIEKITEPQYDITFIASGVILK
ncbi:MAG: DUF4920 domain-containing protein [Bacteroidetes bacterium]|nr:DUF4920 domain-containing protein [Bacteroidota bacterium]